MTNNYFIKDGYEHRNTFMEDLQSGKASGYWLESGDLRREKKERIDISGEVYL